LLRQLPSGAWYYAEEPRYHWIDSFHTGYTLDSIKCYIDQTGDGTFRPHLQRGFRFFKATFFEPDGRPRYYQHRAQPIDIQCASQGMETLVRFAADDPDALPTAVKVARWTIRYMQDPSGYFYYRRYPFVVAKIPMLHWGQATMYRALALLLLTLGQHRTRSQRMTDVGSGGSSAPGTKARAHVCVCICTYKRPESLRRLLVAVTAQETGGLFTYSVVVADNDHLESARPVVAGLSVAAAIAVHYCVEPRQSIALARNQAVAHSSGTSWPSSMTTKRRLGIGSCGWSRHWSCTRRTACSGPSFLAFTRRRPTGSATAGSLIARLRRAVRGYTGNRRVRATCCCSGASSMILAITFGRSAAGAARTSISSAA
jgi:hypothetical protein